MYNHHSIIGDTYERGHFSSEIVGHVSTNMPPSIYFHNKQHIDDAKRLMSAAPCIREQFWSLSKYVLSQLNAIIKARNHQKMSGNIACQLSLDLNGKQKTKHILSHRSSKIDVFHNSPESPAIPTPKQIPLIGSASSVHINNSNSDSEFIPAHSIEIIANPTQCEVDTFDHILQVAAHHDAVYAYYYMDENNKVKVTEIFDMTDSKSPSIQTLGERDANQQLQFDTECQDVMPPTDCMYGGISECHRHHHSHTHMNTSRINNSCSNTTTSNTTNTAAMKNNNNNNTSNMNNNHSKQQQRQFSISDDGHTINEDDLDNLINQSINEWQQQQQQNQLSNVQTDRSDQSNVDDVELNPSTPLISENAAKALARQFPQSLC